MPELPEVQTIVSDLNKVLPGKKVKTFVLRLPKRFYFGSVQPNQNGSNLSKPKAENYSKKIIGEKINSVKRFGKIIIIDFGEWSEVIHLKLTGQLIFQPRSGDRIAGGHPNNDFVASLPVKATNFIWEFVDGSKLFFNDQRKFGYLQLVKTKDLENLKVLKNLGPDALSNEFTVNYLAEKAKNKNISIKQLIMNQAIVAGIGNIYSDEALYKAGILPSRKAKTLISREMNTLYKGIVKALKLGVKYHGASVDNYLDPKGREGKMGRYLLVYGRKKAKCYKCMSNIKCQKLNGRTAHFCPKCQT